LTVILEYMATHVNLTTDEGYHFFCHMPMSIITVMINTTTVAEGRVP